MTPLHVACSHASGETARLLLRNGASGLVPDKSNRTALDMCEAVAPQWPTTRGANGAAVQVGRGGEGVCGRAKRNDDATESAHSPAHTRSRSLALSFPPFPPSPPPQLALSELRVNLAQVAHANEINRKAFAEEAEAKAKAAAAAAANATGGAGQTKEEASAPTPPPPADAAAAAAPGPGGAAHPN